MSKQNLTILGSLTFLILLVFSLVFYKERTFFVDISYHLFYILKDGDFAIQSSRFSAFFTQLFPLIGSKMGGGASLENITKAYSMSFVLLPFLTFLIILLGIKNKRIAIGYLLFITLMTTDAFYWIQSEMPQGLAFFFMLFALLDSVLCKGKKATLTFWIATVALTITACFAHPLIMIPFAFMIAFYVLSFPKKWKLIGVFAIIYVLSRITYSLFFSVPYDSEAISKVGNFITLFPDYFTIQSTKNLVRYMIYDYHFILIVLALNTTYYIRNKQYVKMLLMLTFFIGYCLIVNVSYPGGSPQFYLENQYLLLSIITGIPFAIDILPKVKNVKLQYASLVIICVAGIFRMYFAHQPYTERVEWLRNLMTETATLSNNKIIVPAEYAPLDTLLMTWGTSYEFWLMSTIETGTSRSIIIEEHANEFDWALENKSAFISKWGVFEYEDLDKRYFIFKDTETSYIKYDLK